MERLVLIDMFLHFLKQLSGLSIFWPLGDMAIRLCCHGRGRQLFTEPYVIEKKWCSRKDDALRKIGFLFQQIIENI